MNYNNFPEVDRFSENEDESNAYFKLHFSQKNGFLASKPEDKGCDFLVELIKNKRSMNWWFSVQVKSIEAPSIIENGETISYTFEVSRLLYMLNSVPPVSLIILYWPQNKTFYYDFAENIIIRLLEKRDGDMMWKENKNVNIHIPVKNMVNEENLARIHDHVLKRFENSRDRSSVAYATPPFPGPQGKAPLQEVPDAPAEVLKRKGLEMYYKNEIPQLDQLLDLTPVKLLREDSHLSLLAGITYWSMGLLVEASFFLDKAVKNRSISKDDYEHAFWTKLHVDSYLGRISLPEYNGQVRKLLQNVSADEQDSRLQYELCIARNDIDLLHEGNMRTLFDLANQFFSFNHRINSSRLTADSAVRYYLQNVTNLGLLVIKIDSFFRWKFAKDKKNGIDIDAELVAEIESITQRLTSEIEWVFPGLKPLARNFVGRVMLAQCFESQVSIRLMLDLNALRYPSKKFDFQSEAHKRRITLHTDFSKEAQQIFIEHQLYGSAYNMSLMLLELKEFSAHSEVTLDIDEVAIWEQVEWLREKLDFKPPTLQAKGLIASYKADKNWG